MTPIEIALLGLLLMQQVYYMRQVQKLIDKLMSRSYHEFVGATKPQAKREIKLPTEPAEDLGVLTGFP